ncbi:hypothetical protein C8R46DRAFT_1186343 [Mycena filopes]|nr:hypothetical protein C8R46DRAFT_1186343 [Mycena filopes]
MCVLFSSEYGSGISAKLQIVENSIRHVMPVAVQKPYTREATAADWEEISTLAARAFADDPEMNWFGGLSTGIADTNNPTDKALKLENLRQFLDSIGRSVELVGGRATVVAIPQNAGPEKLVAFAAWVPPHQAIEGILTGLRARTYRSLYAWGLTMFWASKIPDHYRLEITATDPDYQGKGYSRLLMEEGFVVWSSKPTTLEATTAHSHDIYAHQGFEVVESVTLGAGDVDERGLTSSGPSAVGFSVYVMIKWPTKPEL